MNQITFKRLVKARQQHTNATLIVKAEEYSRNKDRLHNFQQAAIMNEQTPEQALWGMLSKHIISIKDMVNDTALGIYPTEAQIDEKLGDVISYMHLLEGLFVDSSEEKMETP